MGRWGKAWASLALAGALAACGGGGGGGGGGPPAVVVAPGGCTTAILLGEDESGCTAPSARAELPTAATSLAEWDTDLGFNQQRGALAEIKVHYAYGTGDNGFYGNGFYGNGVTIAVLADGIETTSRVSSLRDADNNARVTRLTEITFEGSTLTANDTAAVDCGYASPWTCIGTRSAAVMAGRTLGDKTVANSIPTGEAFQGVAFQARVQDVPAGEFWQLHCGTTTAVDCQVDDRADAQVYASVLAAAMRAAVGQSDRPRYVYLHYSGNRNADNNTTVAGFAEYLPVYGDGESPSGDDATYMRHLLSTMGAAVWQGGRADRSVFVVPAGYDRNHANRRQCINFNGDSPTCHPSTFAFPDNATNNPRVFAMLPRIAELVGGNGDPTKDQLAAGMLTVVGLDASLGTGTAFDRRLRIEDGANRCGEAAAWCLTVPMEDFRAPTHRSSAGGSIAARNSGPEYAAALVMGALALVDSAFNAGTNAISPLAIRKRLLDTADRTGVWGQRPHQFGQGRLDIEAALSPQGIMAMTAPGTGLISTVHAPAMPLLGLALALPGHALDILGGTRVMTLDSHGFPFYRQLRDLAHAPLAQASPFATVAAQGPASVVRSPSGLLHISAGMGQGAAWGSALTPQHLAQGGQAGGLAAGAHLASSPLLASSLEAGDTGHMAVRASFGQQSIAAMACTQRHTQRDQDSVQGSGDNACMALGWDWVQGESFGLSVRAHALDSRGGLYRYGTRCFGGSCGSGGATATELGLGGFARLSQGLRLGWNYWHGWADDLDGGSDVVRYEGLGHSAGSIALEGADGVWSLYVQQPLRAEGSLQLVLPERRDPAGNVYFARHDLRLDGASRPVRLGLSSRLDLTRRGGFMALDLGAERGMHGYAGTHPYLAVQTSIPW